MPSKFLLSPEKWWGIYHETGHQAFYKFASDAGFKNGFLSLRDEIVKDIKTAISDTDEKTVKLEINLMFSELYADAFDFSFGFNLDWNLYKDVVWKYFVKHYPVKEDYPYLLRRGLLYFFGK